MRRERAAILWWLFPTKATGRDPGRVLRQRAPGPGGHAFVVVDFAQDLIGQVVRTCVRALPALYSGPREPIWVTAIHHRLSRNLCRLADVA